MSKASHDIRLSVRFSACLFVRCNVDVRWLCRLGY